MKKPTQFLVSKISVAALALLAGSSIPNALADQLANPTVTGSVTPYSSGYTAANLFDTSAGSEFASASIGPCSGPLNNNGTYVELDFGSVVTFDRFILITRNNGVDNVINNRLYVGNNPTHSLSDTIIDFPTAGNNGQGLVQSFAPAAGRYVRWEVLSGTSGGNIGGNQMYFLKAPSGMTHLGAPSVYNSYPAHSAPYAAANAVDGNAGSGNIEGGYASAGGGAGVFIDFDFGATTGISGWDFLNRSGDRITAYEMIFSSSSDFSTGSVTNAYTASSSGVAWNTVALGAPIQARYVRLQATAFSGGNNTGVREILFYGPASAPPTINTQPSGGTYGVGDYGYPLTVVASGAGLSYQWYTNGTQSALTAQTNSVLNLGNVSFSSAGDYTVVVKNSFGSSVTSSVANVVVVAHDSVITPAAATVSSAYSAGQDPANLINGNGLLGSGGILTRTHGNNGSAAGMWHTDGSAVNASWVEFDLGATANLTGMDIWQMNQPGNLGRGVRTFDVFTSPNLSDPATTYAGTFTLRIASGTTNERLQYLSLPAQNVRRVRFALINDWNGFANDYAGLAEVRFEGAQAPVIVQSPIDATNYVLGGEVFSVTVVGSQPLSYQWYKGSPPGVAIPDGTNSAYVLNPVTDTSAGGYFVVVTNALGGATSAVATLTVLNPTPDYTSDLVAYYAFDETTGLSAADSSGNGSTASLFNFPWDDSMWVAGRVGGALEFNSSDASADDEVVTDAALNLTSEDYFTFAFWAKRRSDSNPWNPRFIGPVSAEEGQYWVVWQPNQGIGFYPPARSPEPVRDVWQHFVVTYDRQAGKYETFVDGRFAATATSTNYIKNSPAGRQWAIGCKEILGNTQDPWRGYLDDLRVYNRVLHPGDIKALYEVAGSIAPTLTIQPQGREIFVGETLRLRAAVDGTPPITYQWYKNGTVALPAETNLALTIGNIHTTDAGDYTLVAANALKMVTSAVAHITVSTVTGITNGLAGYWKLDETTGSIAADSSVKHNNGNVLNNLLDGGQWTPGKIGRALNFRGAGLGEDLVAVPAWPQALNGTMSFSAWVLPSVNNTLACIAGAGSGYDGIGQFNLRQQAGGGLAVSVQNASHSAITVHYNPTLPTNAWQQVAVVADGTNVTLYLNGQPMSWTAYDGTLYEVTNLLTLGARAINNDTAFDSFWQGKLDDIGYWTRALSPNEVFQLFAAGSAGNPLTAADSVANPAPVITLQPQGASVMLYGSVFLQVQASSLSVPLSYQWWKDGALIPGAVYNTYGSPAADFTAAGTYRAVVTAANGLSVTSAPAVITIVTAPADLANGLVLHLKLNEISGGIASDATANANAGSLVNFINPDTNWIPGVLDGALLFAPDGVNDTAIAVPSQSYLDFSSGAFSLSLWAKGPAQQAANAGLLCKGLGAGEAYGLDVFGGSYRFFVRDETGQHVSGIQSTVAPDDQWQHLAAVYDPSAGQSQLYINGQNVGTAQTFAALFNTGSTLDVGARQADIGGYIYGFAGRLDDVRVYSRALSPLEVRALVSLGYPPELAIAQQSGQITVSWPLEAQTVYELQSRTDLATGTWNLVPNVTTNSVTVTPGPGAAFYRLHRK